MLVPSETRLLHRSGILISLYSMHSCQFHLPCLFGSRHRVKFTLVIMTQQMAQRIKPADPYNQILNLDSTIRFVGRIKDRKLVTFARNTRAAPLLDEELSNMVHYQASVKASWDAMFNEKLGKTNWKIGRAH